MMELSVTDDAADVWIVIRATLDVISLWARYDPEVCWPRGRSPDQAARECSRVSGPMAKPREAPGHAPDHGKCLWEHLAIDA
jgi:hypothetical protein